MMKRRYLPIARQHRDDEEEEEGEYNDRDGTTEPRSVIVDISRQCKGTADSDCRHRETRRVRDVLRRHREQCYEVRRKLRSNDITRSDRDVSR